MDYETKVRQGVPEPNPGRIWEASVFVWSSVEKEDVNKVLDSEYKNLSRG